jgi:MEMO1 family protein
MASKMRWAWLCLTLVGAGCSACLDRAKPPAQDPAEIRKPDDAPAAALRVRPAAMAGSWYDADKEKLGAYLDDVFAKAEQTPVSGNIVALVSPHAGYSYSARAAASGYRLLRGKTIRRVIVLGLSHRVGFHGASIADVTHYETPLGRIPIDEAAVARLRRSPVVRNVEGADEREHSIEIQLPLLQRVLPRFSLVPILISRMAPKDHVELAAALADIVDAQTLVVASSDFTHRGQGYDYEVPAGVGTLKERLARLDQGTIDAILKIDRAALLAHVAKTGTTVCGAAPIALLLELLSRFKGSKGQVVSRYTSADVSGDWSSSVSYVDIVFTGGWPAQSSLTAARSAGEKVFPLTPDEKRTLLRLARLSLDAAVRKGGFDSDAIKKIPSTPSLQRKAGAFVTLKCRAGRESVCVGKGDDLRGCIGTIEPVRGVYDTVAQRAASAALEDTRFPQRVGTAELPHITVEVSVLTPPRPVRSASEIVVGRHGIILRYDGRGATFLPQVAPEQGWDREQTLEHLARKAGLPSDGWKQASFSVYEAIVFAEGEPR